MKRSLVGLVLGAVLITGMVGCSETAKPVHEVAQVKVKSEEEKKTEYLEFVKQENDKAEEALNEITRLFDKARLHPDLFQSKFFVNDLEVQYEKIENIYFRLKLYKETEIPKDLLNSHNTLVEAYQNCYNGNNFVLDGINERNPEKMKQGADLMRDGAYLMRVSGLDN